MPNSVPIESKQTMRVLVSGPDGANTMFITTGLASALNARVMDSDATTPASNPNYSILLDEPRLNPGQFRGATATVGLAFFNFDENPLPVGAGKGASIGIVSVGAALDNETGLVKLQFQLHVGAARADVELSRISFQVITLAAVAAERRC